MRFLKAILLLLVFFIGLLFFVQNSAILGQKMSLVFDLYFRDAWTSVEVPFFFLILVAFAVGMLLGIVLMFLDRLRLSGELRGMRRSCRTTEKELADLKEAMAKATAEKAPQQSLGEAPYTG